jgi:hypothetical protein
MCCFSRPVQSVNGTNIFARMGAGGRQFLVYSMMLKTKEDLAMILPIPVPPKTGEKAVQFINLEDYPKFFEAMSLGFQPRFDSRSKAGGVPPPKAATIEVVQVGSFEASFVPTVKDFSRLDARFRLPDGTWDRLPQYEKYGFAVFKLKSGAHKIHPMAFSFPSAQPGRLFFPTVHIHDGKIHATAHFDHALFCQKGPGAGYSTMNWMESGGVPRNFMEITKCKGTILPDEHIYTRGLHGRKPNTDTWLG